MKSSEDAMDKKVNDLLNFDSLLVAEEMTGKSYKDDEKTSKLGLLLHMELSKLKKEVLDGQGDTYYSMPWKDWTKIALELGFNPIHKHSYQCFERQEIFNVWYHKDGIILRWSTCGDQINHAKMEYNWRPTIDDTSVSYQCLSSGQWDIPPEHAKDWDWFEASKCTWIGDHDVREAFVHKLKTLRKHGKFITPWVKTPHLWFIDYEQTQESPIRVDEINAQVIESFPQEVKDMMGINKVEKGVLEKRRSKIL